MFENQLNNLVNQLYPTGKAFNISYGSVFFKLHQSLNDSFLGVIDDSQSLFDSIFPDSDGFTEKDASLWEYHLGLKIDLTSSLDQRKDAILRKMTHPNNTKSRQSRIFIESQLRLAGYDVYVHENTPPYKNPEDFSSIPLKSFEYGSLQYGNNTQYGVVGFDSIANSSNPNENYLAGDKNLWSTFFIGGENLGDYVYIEANLIQDFRELVLKLKPAHTVAYIYVITTEDLIERLYDEYESRVESYGGVITAKECMINQLNKII